MAERRIDADDVELVAGAGEVINVYKDEKPSPCFFTAGMG